MEKNNNLLLVDDEARILKSIQRLLQKEDYQIFTATSGQEALEIVKSETFGVVISDLMMPEMDGIQFLEQSTRINPDMVQILLTGNASLDAAMDAINRLGLFGFITKPWNNEVLKTDVRRAFERYNLLAENKHLYQLTEKQNKQLKEMNDSLEEKVKIRTQLLDEAMDESILMLAKAAEAKDDDTDGHIHRIYSLVFDICETFDLSDAETVRISQFSMVHDIGKLSIDDAILKNRGSLTPEERAIKESHTLRGEEMLGVKPFYKTAREIVRSHHERWDGSGYPDGLKEKDIPLAARIVAVADTFDTFTRKAPYKDAWDLRKALEKMKSLAGVTLDPVLVDTFMNVQAQRLKRRKKRAGQPAAVKE